MRPCQDGLKVSASEAAARTGQQVGLAKCPLSGLERHLHPVRFVGNSGPSLSGRLGPPIVELRMSVGFCAADGPNSEHLVPH